MDFVGFWTYFWNFFWSKWRSKSKKAISVKSKDVSCVLHTFEGLGACIWRPKSIKNRFKKWNEFWKAFLWILAPFWRSFWRPKASKIDAENEWKNGCDFGRHFSWEWEGSAAVRGARGEEGVGGGGRSKSLEHAVHLLEAGGGGFMSYRTAADLSQFSERHTDRRF